MLVYLIRNNPPSSNCAKAVQDLFSLASRNTWNFTGHYIDLAKFKGMHLDIDDIETLGEKHKLEASMSSHECIECPQLQEHVSVGADAVLCMKYISYM